MTAIDEIFGGRRQDREPTDRDDAGSDGADPDDAGLKDAGPNDAHPDGADPDDGGSDDEGPDHGGPGRGGPDHGGPDRAGPEDAVDPDPEPQPAGGARAKRRTNASPSRHRAEPAPVDRGRWARPLAALVLPLVGLPVLALPSGGVGQLLDVTDLVTGDVDAGAVGALLLLLLWLLWLQLAACVAVEVVSAVRGSGLPPRVRFATVRQQEFARRHVAQLLLAISPHRRFQPDRYRSRAFRRVAGAEPQPPPQEDPMESAAAEAQRLRQARRQRPPLLRWDVVDAGIMSAGLLDALATRRHRAMLTRPVGRVPALPDAEASGIEVAARVGADPGGAQVVDRTLRWLAATLDAAGAPPPRVLAVRLTADAVELLFGAPRTDLPEPFEASGGNRRWTLARTVDLPPPPDVPAPAPALVSLGGDGVGRVLVDLAACQGVTCIAGDRNAVRSVVAAAAVELVTAPWADGSAVTLIGFGDQLAPLGGRRLRCADSLADVVEEVTDRLSEARQGTRPAQPEVVVLAAAPEADELADLAAWFLPLPERSSLSVLVAGDVPDAAWRFELDREGVLDTGPLQHPVGAQAISARTFAALGRLVQADGEDEPASEDTVAAPRPLELDSVRVLLQLFGGPAARGDVGPGADLAVEIAAYAALHDLVTLPELSAAVWPRGVADSVRNDAIRRTQWWLGLDATGRPRLALEDGVLRLSPEVQTDWSVFVALMSRGDLGSAVGLLAGEPVAPVGGRYAWLAREPLARRIGAVVADSCAWAADQLTVAGDRKSATAVAVAGLTVSPYAGPLWAVLEAAAADDDHRAEVRAVRDARIAALAF